MTLIVCKKSYIYVSNNVYHFHENLHALQTKCDTLLGKLEAFGIKLNIF